MLAEVSMLVSCVIAIYVGLRTLWIYLRTRGIQELAVGLNVISIAVGGTILTMVGVLGQSDPAIFDSTLSKSGMVFLALHLAAIYFGTWAIFHRSSRSILLCCFGVLVIIGFWLVMAVQGAGTVWVRPILFQMLRAVGMTWSAFECFSYSDRLLRQARLGLADPLMAHRFWLWAVGATSALIVCTLELFGWGLGESSFSAPPLGLTITAGLGFVGSLSVGLAFFPPAVYQRWMSRRLGGGTGARRAASVDPG